MSHKLLGILLCERLISSIYLSTYQSSINLFTQSFDIFDLINIILEYIHIPIWTQEYLFYSLGSNPIQLYVLVQIVPTLATGFFFS